MNRELLNEDIKKLGTSKKKFEILKFFSKKKKPTRSKSLSNLNSPKANQRVPMVSRHLSGKGDLAKINHILGHT